MVRLHVVDYKIVNRSAILDAADIAEELAHFVDTYSIDQCRGILPFNYI